MIYFLHIRSGERAGTTKVGTSVTPGDRIVTIVNTLQCAATLHAVEPGGLDEERDAHDALHFHRVMFGGHREHFRTDAVLEYINGRKVRVLDLPCEYGNDSHLAALHEFDAAILRETAEATRNRPASHTDIEAINSTSWLLSQRLQRLERAEFRLARSTNSDAPRIRATIARCQASLAINAGNVYGNRAQATLAAKLLQLAEAERLVAATQENLNRLADTETPMTTNVSPTSVPSLPPACGNCGECDACADTVPIPWGWQRGEWFDFVEGTIGHFIYMESDGHRKNPTLASSDHAFAFEVLVVLVTTAAMALTHEPAAEAQSS